MLIDITCLWLELFPYFSSTDHILLCPLYTIIAFDKMNPWMKDLSIGIDLFVSPM